MKRYILSMLSIILFCSSNSVASIDSVLNYTEIEYIESRIARELITNFKLPPSKASWYSSLISDASLRYNVPKSLIIAVIATESSFNPEAKSRSGAIGSMQVIPSHHPDNPFDATNPQSNVLAGTYILRKYKNVCGNWVCAVKSYNIGITAYTNGKQEDAADRYYYKITSNLAIINI